MAYAREGLDLRVSFAARPTKKELAACAQLATAAFEPAYAARGKPFPLDTLMADLKQEVGVNLGGGWARLTAWA